jgi:hypothetical protein
MTAKRICKHLEALGYSQTPHPSGYSAFYTFGPKGIVVDSMKARSYRLFLGLNCIPATHPGSASVALGQIDAESPWFEFRNPEEKERITSDCIHWIDTVGLPFLSDPFSKELHRWITEDKILIRDNGVILPIPKVRRLP